MGGTINEQFPVGVTKTMVLEQQIRVLRDEVKLESAKLNSKLSRVIAERDTLRAELAAAKEAIEDIERTLEIAEIPKYGSSGDRIPWNERVELLADDRDALAAHVERLEKGLRVARELTREEPDIYVVGIRRVIDELIATTPAQSLAAHDAALLRRLAGKWKLGEVTEISLWLRIVADDIEKEAANG